MLPCTDLLLPVHEARPLHWGMSTFLVSCSTFPNPQQLIINTLQDEAGHLVLDAFEWALEGTSVAAHARRHRIENAPRFNGADLERAARLGSKSKGIKIEWQPNRLASLVSSGVQLGMYGATAMPSIETRLMVRHHRHPLLRLFLPSL